MEDSQLGITDSGDSSQPQQQQQQPPSGSSGNGPKRNKISRACDECRKRKVRCDGAQPCLRCQKSRSECVFVKVTPKRGPPKQYVETLEPRLRDLEHILRVLQTETTPYDPALVLTPENRRRQSSSTSILPQQTDGIGVGSIGQGLYVHDLTTRVDRIPCIYDQYSYREHDPSAGSISLNDIMEPPQPKLHPSTIAGTTIQNDLIQLYFQHVHPFLPIINPSTFRAQLTNAPCYLLLNAMYAVASRWHNVPRDPNDTHPPGWRYYQAAFSLVDIYTDTPRLSTIQALVLMIKYQEHVRRSGFFFRPRYYFQNIVHMSRDLGLAKAIPQGYQLDLHLAEQRRRTFWAVYAYDILMSTELGSEPHFAESHITVEYPSALPDEIQSESKEAFVYFFWLAKLVHLQGSILRFARKKYTHSSNNLAIAAAAAATRKEQSDESSAFRNLQLRLEEFSTKMSSDIKLSNISYSSQFHHLLLHSCIILLHRPRALLNSNDSIVFQERCTDSASTITHLVETLLQTRGIDCFHYPIRGIQYTVYCLASAITVHRCLSGIQGQQESCNKALGVMQQLLDKTPAVEIGMDRAFDPALHQYHYHHPFSSSTSYPSSYQHHLSSIVNTSPSSLSPASSRSSPILASSTDMMRSKSRRTSLASLPSTASTAPKGGGTIPGNTTAGNGAPTTNKRRPRASSNLATTTAAAANAASSAPFGQPTSIAANGTPRNNPETMHRMHQHVPAQQRMSMPLPNYHPPPVQPMSYSQPSSPSGYYQDYYSAGAGAGAAVVTAAATAPQTQTQPLQPVQQSPMGGNNPAGVAANTVVNSNLVSMPPPPMTGSKPSPFYKQALRSSSVAAAAAAQQQQQQQQQQQPQPSYDMGPPTRTVSTPYMPRVPASQRRHTISGYQEQQPISLPATSSDPFLAMSMAVAAAAASQQSSTAVAGPAQGMPMTAFYYQQPQQQQQDMMIDYPMDPVMPDPPSGSMMELLMDQASHTPFLERGA